MHRLCASHKISEARSTSCTHYSHYGSSRAIQGLQKISIGWSVLSYQLLRPILQDTGLWPRTCYMVCVAWGFLQHLAQKMENVLKSTGRVSRMRLQWLRMGTLITNGATIGDLLNGPWQAVGNLNYAMTLLCPITHTSVDSSTVASMLRWRQQFVA